MESGATLACRQHAAYLAHRNQHPFVPLFRKQEQIQYTYTPHRTPRSCPQVKKDVKAKEVAFAAYTLPPKVWDEARLRQWLAKRLVHSGRGESLAAALPHLPAGVTGKAIMCMSLVVCADQAALGCAARARKRHLP